MDPSQMMFFGAGVLGCMMSYCTYWACSVTRGSTISFTGAMTKIPVVLLGYLIFDTKISVQGWGGICLNLLSGIFFTYVKGRETMEKAVKGGKSSLENIVEDEEVELKKQAVTVIVDPSKELNKSI